MEVAQTSQDAFMADGPPVSVDSSFGSEAVETGFNPNAYESLNTEATSGLDLNKASDDIDMGQTSRNGSIFSSGAWESLMNWSPSTAPSVLALDRRSSDRLSLPRDTVPSPTTDVMPFLRGIESAGSSISTELHFQKANNQPITCAGFDSSSTLLPLLSMKAQLEQDFCSDPDLKDSLIGFNMAKLRDAVNSEWLKLELENLLCWNCERYPQDIRQHHARRRIGKLASLFEKSRDVSSNRRRSGDTRTIDEEVHIVRTSYATSRSHSGLLTTKLGTLPNQEQHTNSLEVLKLCFIPKSCRRTIGLCATFFNVMSEIRCPKISPRLKSFNVIPDDSKIIECLKRNDLNGLQTLFDRREASPTDFDSNGFSLLSVSAHVGNAD